LGERDHRRGRSVLILQAREPKRKQLRLDDLLQHVDKLLLGQLEGSDRLAELNARKSVVASAFEAGDRCSGDAARNSKPRVVEAGQRAFEALDVGQDVAKRDLDVLQAQLGGVPSAQRKIPPWISEPRSPGVPFSTK